MCFSTTPISWLLYLEKATYCPAPFQNAPGFTFIKIPSLFPPHCFFTDIWSDITISAVGHISVIHTSLRYSYFWRRKLEVVQCWLPLETKRAYFLDIHKCPGSCIFLLPQFLLECEVDGWWAISVLPFSRFIPLRCLQTWMILSSHGHQPTSQSGYLSWFC